MFAFFTIMNVELLVGAQHLRDLGDNKSEDFTAHKDAV